MNFVIGRLAAISALCLAGTGADAFQEEVDARVRHYENHRIVTLENYDDGGRASRAAHLGMTEYFPHAVIHRAGPIRALPESPREDVAAFTVETYNGRLSVADYVAGDPRVDGAVVVHDGNIVFGAFPRMDPFEKHLLWSVSKPFAGLAVALLEERGLIDTTQDVTDYLPALEGSGWDGVTVRQVLDMQSGIDCDELAEGAYTDPEECYYHAEASWGFNPRTERTPDTPFDYMARLERHRSPGEVFEYTSVNTFVLAWLVEAVSGLPYADFLSGEIWRKIGAEADAFLAISKAGAPVAHGGISATLRDVARFGLAFTSDAGGDVVSGTIVEAIQTTGNPDAYLKGKLGQGVKKDLRGEVPRHNAYHWDVVMADGDFYKGGFGGQGLYVSPARDLVIAWFGTHPGMDQTSNDMLYVARQLATSGLFE